MKPLFLLLPFLFNVAFAQYKLALNLQNNNTYSLAVHTDVHFSGTIDGQKTNVSAMMNGVMRFRVINSSDSDYTLSASCDSFKVTMRSPLGKMEFSSGDSSMEDGQVSSPAKSLSQKHWDVTLRRNGSIRKLNDPDTAGMAAMMKRLPMLDMLKRMMMTGNSRNRFRHRMMKENFEKLTALFPDRKVPLNDTWGATVNLDSAGSHQIKMTNQLVSYADGFATIRGHREFVESPSAGDRNGMGANLSMKEETTAMVRVSASTGWVNDATSKTTITGQAGKQGQSGNIDPFTLTISTHLTGY